MVTVSSTVGELEAREDAAVRAGSWSPGGGRVSWSI